MFYELVVKHVELLEIFAMKQEKSRTDELSYHTANNCQLTGKTIVPVEDHTYASEKGQ